ncbi:MAG: hypothetical protein N2255_03675, partial [Kiritimatiellae bacterium]|nr:hypothetical protein [Kiritimatiellia bacterium]
YKRQGYNAVILSADQPLGDWYADDYAAKTMPESWAGRIGEASGLAERYLPRLRSRLKWTEGRRTVLLVGNGEERILEAVVSKPDLLVKPVSRGTCRLGYELHSGLNIKAGDEIRIQGRCFRVESCEEELGTKDDITIWLTLADAQELLDLQGQINEILIVEHIDVWGNLPEVKRKVAAVLPGCQVVEIKSQTLARLQARRETAEEAEASIRREREKQAALWRERKRMAFFIGVVSFLVCTLWVGMFMFLNVRERTAEIAILNAMGFSLAQLRNIILFKALVVGVTGGLFGGILGLIMGLRGAGGITPAAGNLLGYLALALGVTVVASLLGSWFPTRSVSRVDPATILGGE